MSPQIPSLLGCSGRHMSGLPGRCHRVGQGFDERRERLREVTYLLVAGDYFTKWQETFGVPNQEAKTAVDNLVKEVHFRIWGTRKDPFRPGAKENQAQLFQEMGILFNMDKTRTSPYHPESMCPIITMTGTTTPTAGDDGIPFQCTYTHAVHYLLHFLATSYCQLV